MTGITKGICGLILIVALISQLVSRAFGDVQLPRGIWASSGAQLAEVLNHPQNHGVLIRVLWRDIEPEPDAFNFKPILKQADAARKAGKQWSLAVIGGGIGSPDWLRETCGAASVSYRFRGKTEYELPLAWDPAVLNRLQMLAHALGRHFNQDPSLALVYVTQMTSNGIEGHLQGVDMNSLRSAGYTKANWVEASQHFIRAFAVNFPDKPIAFEVHEIDHSAEVPAEILSFIREDPELRNQVGAGMWWLSGSERYQSELIKVLEKFDGPIYGQVIARSDQTYRLPEGYAAIFEQAKSLDIRYIEIWEYELGPHSLVDPHLLAEFNEWALQP